MGIVLSFREISPPDSLSFDSHLEITERRKVIVKPTADLFLVKKAQFQGYRIGEQTRVFSHDSP